MATAYHQHRRIRTRPYLPTWFSLNTLATAVFIFAVSAVPISVAFYAVNHVDQSWGDDEWRHAGHATALIPIGGGLFDAERFQVRTKLGEWNVVGSKPELVPRMEVRLSNDGRIRINGQAYKLLYW